MELHVVNGNLQKKLCTTYGFCSPVECVLINEVVVPAMTFLCFLTASGVGHSERCMKTNQLYNTFRPRKFSAIGKLHAQRITQDPIVMYIHVASRTRGGR